MYKLLRINILVIMSVALLNGCKDEEIDINPLTSDFSSEVATEWATLVLKLSKESPGFTPPVVARSYSCIGLTLYESIRAGMPGYNSMKGQINGLAVGVVPEIEEGVDYNWALVANSALALVIRQVYSNASAENITAIDDLESHWESQFPDEEQEVIDRSKAHGIAVAEAMIAHANADDQEEAYLNNFPVSYVPPVGEGMWVPTPPAYANALQPYWGEVRPCLTKNIDDNLPEPPLAYSTDITSAFYLEAKEVYDVVENLTDEQLLIAQYWSDDPGLTATPPGHSLSIAIQVLQLEDADLALAAETFAKIGMGVHDAFISCWNAKYHYNLLRPVTYIIAEIDAGFTTPLTTPPFPEYTSGHSVQSGAASQVLTDIFGENYAFTDRTHESRVDIDGSPRSFDSFFDFADEAAISRLYGGIHYRKGIDVGVEQGKVIGNNINDLDWN